MPIYQGLVTAYAKAIYKDGTKRFADIRPEYVIPVKQYAGTNYTALDIEIARDNGWITAQEYTDTMAYKPV